MVTLPKLEILLTRLVKLLLLSIELQPTRVILECPETFQATTEPPEPIEPQVLLDRVVIESVTLELVVTINLEPQLSCMTKLES